MPEYLLAIDQGTTNTKALLVDKAGTIVARAFPPLTQSYPRPAWVEQDAQEIWHSVSQAIDDVMASAGDPHFAGIAISNQRETVTMWERRNGQASGAGSKLAMQPRRPLLRRAPCQNLESTIHSRTGLTIDPMFSGSKARWLLDNVHDGRRRAEQGEICLGTVDSWVLWNLTGGNVTPAM